MPKAVKNLRNFRPDASQAKHVDDTKMLDTTPTEVNMSEKNVTGEEHVVSHPDFGPLGAVGRH